MWFDQMAIPADAPHVDEAHAFINYMHEAGSRGARRPTTSSTPTATRPRSSSSTRRCIDDPAIYPDEATLAKLFTVAPYDPQDAAHGDAHLDEDRHRPVTRDRGPGSIAGRRSFVWDMGRRRRHEIARQHPQERSRPGTIPAAKPFIDFENVTKRFGDFTAVNNLSLDIYEREFFALLGASGLRQDHAAADARRLRGADRGPHPARRPGLCAASRPTGGRST